ncbi:MAG: hypothetical protein R3E62_02750 [Pseudomonadales bacterium]|jgi:hypothetical protein
MTYQEMVDTLAAMSEPQRRDAIQEHWQAVFSDGFIAFVQGQMEAGRKMVLSGSEMDRIFDGLDPSVVAVLKQEMLKNMARLVTVWDSMVVMYERLQKQSERQGNSQGMVGHGQHQTMPRGVAVGGAVNCYRCGSPVTSQGLCSGCLATQQDWEQDDLDYERQQYDQQLQDQEYQRTQDDQLYYDTQQDFNTYTDYSSDY